MVSLFPAAFCMYTKDESTDKIIVRSIFNCCTSASLIPAFCISHPVHSTDGYPVNQNQPQLSPLTLAVNTISLIKKVNIQNKQKKKH